MALGIHPREPQTDFRGVQRTNMFGQSNWHWHTEAVRPGYESQGNRCRCQSQAGGRTIIFPTTAIKKAATSTFQRTAEFTDPRRVVLVTEVPQIESPSTPPRPDTLTAFTSNASEQALECSERLGKPGNEGHRCARLSQTATPICRWNRGRASTHGAQVCLGYSKRSSQR